MSFKPLVVYKRWGRWDRLDGKDIEHGEAVEVLWPDKTITKHHVYVEKSSRLIPEGTSDQDFPDHRSHIWVEVHGARVKIQLRESELLLRRLKKSDQLLSECILLGADADVAKEWTDPERRRFIEEKSHPEMQDDANEANSGMESIPVIHGYRGSGELWDGYD